MMMVLASPTSSWPRYFVLSEEAISNSFAQVRNEKCNKNTFWYSSCLNWFKPQSFNTSSSLKSTFATEKLYPARSLTSSQSKRQKNTNQKEIKQNLTDKTKQRCHKTSACDFNPGIRCDGTETQRIGLVHHSHFFGRCANWNSTYICRLALMHRVFWETHWAHTMVFWRPIASIC